MGWRLSSDSDQSRQTSHSRQYWVGRVFLYQNLGWKWDWLARGGNLALLGAAEMDFGESYDSQDYWVGWIGSAADYWASGLGGEKGCWSPLAGFWHLECFDH